MDCCSSNYMDYRHSMNNNFCYPYSPGMMRSASPYPMGTGLGVGHPGGTRYGSDYRAGYYDNFEKYYGFHHAQGHNFGSTYYGNYSPYRDFSYNDYYHPPPSSASSHHFSGPGAYHGLHMYNRQPLPFQRESYYHQRDHHQYANFSNYSGNPYKGDSSSSATAPLVNGSNGNNHGNSGGSNATNNSGSPLFGAQNGYTHSPDYSAQSYNSNSPNHPHHPQPQNILGESVEGAGGGYTSTMPNATGFSLSVKDARMRRLKERKLAKSSYCNSPNGGQNSTSSSPNPGNSGNAGNSSSSSSNNNTSARLKSLDAFVGDSFEHDHANNPSPGRCSGSGGSNTGGSPPKRPKKQSSKNRAAEHDRESKSGDRGNGANPNASSMAVADKTVTPLPGFQQAFGSTEIGKFSEAFFNSSPSPNALHQNGQLSSHHHPHHHSTHHQLMMNSLSACESDVDTLSPQPWEPTGPGDPFESTTGFNLQIGTSFHPSYYESSSYSSDHAVDSPLGNYFSEMTCNEYVN